MVTMDCFVASLLAMTGPQADAVRNDGLNAPRHLPKCPKKRSGVWVPAFAGTTIIQTSSLLHQRIARGGELLKFLRVAAGVRMGALGSALVGLVDLRPGQAAAERQAEHLPVTLRGCERLRVGLALAELPGVKRVQDVSDNAEAAPRGIPGDRVRVFGRSVAQDWQRLRGRLPQHRLFARSCHIGGKARGFGIVGRGRRANPLNAEFPFRELSIHRATPSGINITSR